MLLVSNEFNRSMGLGNKLFSWARAYCTTKILDASQIEPRWFALRNAGILRGGIDYKNLFGKTFLYNNFKSDPEAINRLYLEIHGRLKAHPPFNKYYLDDLADLKKHHFIDRDWIVYRADQSHYFSDLAEHHHAIRQKLEQLSKKSALCGLYESPFIAINYRSGNDFKAHDAKDSQAKTDLHWFIRAVDFVRRQYGNLPVYIISDGAPHHLVDLVMGVKNCQVRRFGTAIEDLWFLSKSKVLLASGNSSFSAWAAFLSGADSFSSKDTPLDRWRINANNLNQTIGIIE
jgi:Glycosyl transferase family 11